MWKDFQAFAIRGNVVDMAVGVMIGAAFAGVVDSLVTDILSPPLGLLTQGVAFSDQFVVLSAGTTGGPYDTLSAAEADGAVVVAFGAFLDQCLSFLLVAFVLFLVVRWINDLRSPDTPPAPDTKACPACTLPISIKATRCPHCTTEQATDAGTQAA